MSRPTDALALIPIVLGGATASGVPINITRDSPTLDRWMYPFNGSTPGTRPSAPTFGALGQTELGGFTFDERDAQVLIGFDLSADLPADLCRYRITQATVRIAVSTDQTFVYDPSFDARQTYFAEAGLPGGVADGDPGRPIELFGLGYRNGFTLASFAESTPFGASIASRVRNAFATDYQGGSARDISNSLADIQTVTPFAIGSATGVAPGALVPANTDFRFDLSLSNPDVEAYLHDAIDAGKLNFAIASMFPASSPGGPGTGNYPTFYMKENLFGAGRRARLTLTVVPCIPGDLNCSGMVDVEDLNLVLGDWLGSGPGDANCDGATNVDDLNIVLGNWLATG